MGTTNLDALELSDGLTVGGVSFSGAVRGGSYVATSDDATANALTIDTGLTTVGYFSVFILRSDVPIFSDQDVSEAAGVITVADGAATYSVTAGDVVNWLAVGS